MKPNGEPSMKNPDLLAAQAREQGLELFVRPQIHHIQPEPEGFGGALNTPVFGFAFDGRDGRIVDERHTLEGGDAVLEELEPLGGQGGVPWVTPVTVPPGLREAGDEPALGRTSEAPRP